ncbi:MAG: hypothetical protein IPO08_21925 [Xanthomonadales bacterium]|nr:hypothetical protein [Xanthomonadales bacterium]
MTDLPKRRRCKGCDAIGYFIADYRGRCLRCRGSDFEERLGTYGHQTILYDGAVHHGTKCIDLQVHDRHHATMVTCPIVWDGTEYTVTFPSIGGVITLKLGPVFEFENAEKVIRREVNRASME